MTRLAILPAFNEAASVASVVAEVRAADPGFEILVVDDGSSDETARVALEAGAHVLRLAHNLGIGGAVQSGFRYARERGFDIAVQVDADGQHDPADLPKLLAPLLAGDADVVIGSRFAEAGDYRASPLRRLAMRFFATTVSLVAQKRLTDTSSAFRAVNRRGIQLYSAHYPDGFLETVEATVIAVRNGLRVVEVPVAMRQRANGCTSLTISRSVYFAAAVLVGILAGAGRRSAPGLEP